MTKAWDDMPQPKRFHAALRPGDTAEVTLGCRHTNPDICRNNAMAGICAFVRPDGMCHSPPRSWPVQFKKLQSLADGGEER